MASFNLGHIPQSSSLERPTAQYNQRLNSTAFSPRLTPSTVQHHTQTMHIAFRNSKLLFHDPRRGLPPTLSGPLAADGFPPSHVDNGFSRRLPRGKVCHLCPAQQVEYSSKKEPLAQLPKGHTFSTPSFQSMEQTRQPTPLRYSLGTCQYISAYDHFGKSPVGSPTRSG